MPSAPSGGTATAVSNVLVVYGKSYTSADIFGGGSYKTGVYTFPTGGTWRYIKTNSGSYTSGGQCSGGATLTLSFDGQSDHIIMAIRVA